jgi:hypothetical protein
LPKSFQTFKKIKIFFGVFLTKKGKIWAFNRFGGEKGKFFSKKKTPPF